MAEGYSEADVAHVHTDVTDAVDLQKSNRACTSQSHALVLRPLFFPEDKDEGREENYCLLGGLHDVPISCIVCDKQFDVPSTAKDDFLKHLLLEHKVVIHKAHQVCSLSRYAAYWKSRLKENKMADYMAVIRNHTSQSKDSPTEDYYLLSDALKEDAALRERLHLQRLRVLLAIQEEERRRDTDAVLTCLFCSHEFSGRKELFHHMWDLHNFNIGHSDNMVFVDEFLTALREMLEKFQCLYCEKTFHDRQTLKDHMRKKQHRKLNPDNRVYDKYYIVNYLEVGKTWREMNKDEEREGPSRYGDVDESEWSDVLEEDERVPFIHCLFCAEVNKEWAAVEDHMKTAHSFSLETAPSGGQMDFYLKVKAVNYVRRQVHFGVCPCCEGRFSENGQLKAHMETDRHWRLPDDVNKWNHSQYLFSTYENDAMLFHLDTSDSDGSGDDDDPTASTAAEQASGISDDEQARVLLGRLMEDIEQDEVGHTETAVGEEDGMPSEGNVYICSEKEQQQN